MKNAVLSDGTLQPKPRRTDARRYLPVVLFNGAPSPMFFVETTPMFHTFATGDIKGFNEQFIGILNKLGGDVQRLGVDLRDYNHDYIERLRTKGLAAYNHFIPEQMEQYIQGLDQEERNRGLQLTFTVSPETSLFWEMLYDGSPLGKVCSEHFWGFRYSIGRNYLNVKPHEYIAIQKGVFCSVHQQLEYSMQEAERLSKWIKEVCERFGLNLTSRLLDEHTTVDGLSTETIIGLFNSEDFSYGVVHFACHYSSPADDGATQAYLSVTTHEKEMDISLENLICFQKKGFRRNPFVFVNACSSATPQHLLETITLPNTLLKFGAGGVIATACTIPDNFASAFASEFYQRLLNKTTVDTRANISEALLDTRLHFLRKYNNPLGLAYGLYAGSKQELCLKS
jgi:hypothetical protein